MKIRPVERELFHANKRTDGRRGRQTDSQSVKQTERKTDGQTGMAKLFITFVNFMKASIISI